MVITLVYASILMFIKTVLEDVKFKFSTPFYCNVAITVNFSKLNYSAEEKDGQVQPVLILSNPSSTDVTVRVDTADKEAIGECFMI